MFFVLVVQRVEDGDRHLRVAHVTGRGLLLPEAIAGAHVQQVVAADAGVGRYHSKWGQFSKCTGYRIARCAVIMVGDLTIEPVIPLPSQAGVPLEPGSASNRGIYETLSNFLIGVVE